MLRMTPPSGSSSRPLSMPSLVTRDSSDDDDSIDDAAMEKLHTPLRPIMPAHLQRVVIAATWSPVPHDGSDAAVRLAPPAALLLAPRAVPLLTSARGVPSCDGLWCRC